MQVFLEYIGSDSMHIVLMINNIGIFLPRRALRDVI